MDPKANVPRRMSEYVQQDQPPGVPPLALTGERTLPDVPAENYWYRRHEAVYEWIAERILGRKVVDLACGEGYGTAILARGARSVIGVDANPEAFEHARAKYTTRTTRFERDLIDTWQGEVDCVVFLQTIEHVQDPDATMAHVKELVGTDGHRLHLHAQRPHPRPRGRREVREPLAHQGVPRRGVPGAVREAVRHRRPLRRLPRAQARPARARAQARLGPDPQGAAADQAVLRPLHPGHRGRRLPAAQGRRRRA